LTVSANISGTDVGLTKAGNANLTKTQDVSPHRLGGELSVRVCASTYDPAVDPPKDEADLPVGMLLVGEEMLYCDDITIPAGASSSDVGAVAFQALPDPTSLWPERWTMVNVTASGLITTDLGFHGVTVASE